MATKRLFDSAAEIPEEAILEGIEDVARCPTLPKLPNMAKQLNHLRENIRPKEPTTTTFVMDAEHLPAGFLRRDILEGERRFVLLGSDIMMHHLARMKTWYMDATFKVVRAPFMQLFSIHGFMKSGNCMKQVPLLFVLMSGRRAADYTTVFRAILDVIPGPISLQKCVADFEAAMWQRAPLSSK